MQSLYSVQYESNKEIDAIWKFGRKIRSEREYWRQCTFTFLGGTTV